MSYRKIPKICPRTYIFQRPFLRGLFLEGLICLVTHISNDKLPTGENGNDFNRFPHFISLRQ